MHLVSVREWMHFFSGCFRVAIVNSTVMALFYVVQHIITKEAASNRRSLFITKIIYRSIRLSPRNTIKRDALNFPVVGIIDSALECLIAVAHFNGYSYFGRRYLTSTS